MSLLGWNRDFALEQAAGEAELLQELIDLFKASFESDYSIIESGLESEDAGMIASAAHSIKGAAASLGVEAVSAVAHQLEQEGNAGRIELVREIMPQLQQMLQEVKKI